MPTARRLQNILAARASESFVGRAAEIGKLLECLKGHGPLVTYLHGIGGIGKSSLLKVFSAQVRARGACFLQLDCRLIEPTPQGFFYELSKAIDSPVHTVEEASHEMARLGRRVVLSIDTYELFRLLDTWLRQTFIPGLSDAVRIVLSGRMSPSPSWLVAPEWQGLFRSMSLGPLSEAEALELCARAQFSSMEGTRLNRLARGHPLALRLAMAAAEHASIDVEEVITQSVVEQLTEIYLSDVTDPTTRKGIEAASVIRRVTQPLLLAMLPEVGSQDLYERLRALSFVDSSRDGLIIHDAVKAAVSSSLRSSDPMRYREYRRAAWHQLRSEVRSASIGEMWRYSADMLYMLENPFIREAFFPSGLQQLAVEPARPKDDAAIAAIAERHESPAAAKILKYWWEHSPQSFHVTRDGSGAVAGFYLMLEPGKMTPAALRGDPIASACWQHLQDNEIPREQTAILLRRWLSLESGELPSAVQGACWLDVKRSYMNLRPYLRRCYISVCDLEPYRPTAEKLQFKLIEKASISIDGITHHMAVLDFGPGSIDSWLTGLVAGELGLEKDGILDADARELVLDGKRIGLTVLEFGVLRYLYQLQGKAVARTELLRDVWGCAHDNSSNVVDVVVRSLRQKMRDHASVIETVRGVGYRFRSP